MSHIINAVYENGVFKPLENVSIKEHKKVRIILENEAESVIEEGCTLAGIIDIAKDCPDIDLSVHHDKYLYGAVKDI